MSDTPEATSSYSINSPKYPYDMSAWCAEKSSCAAEQVSLAFDAISKHERLDSSTRENLQCLLSCALYDLSKLMAFSVGEDWSVADADDVRENGFEGYQRVAVKYGIISPVATQEEQLAAFCESLNSLLHGTRAPNRTFVHELLNKTVLDHPVVEKARNLIEEVTMGEMEWAEFCSTLKASIYALDLPVQEKLP